MPTYLVTAWSEHYTHVEASSPDAALRLSKGRKAEWHPTLNKPFEFYEVEPAEGAKPAGAPRAGQPIERLWVVSTPMPDVLAEMWTDPAYTDDEVRLAHFCGALAEPDGYDIDQFVRVYWGGQGHLRWDREKSKLYTDVESARRDATARLDKARKTYSPKPG